MFPPREALYTSARPKVGRSHPILVLVLVTVGIAFAPSIAPAQLLSLSWIDNSGGQAIFIIQRATSTAGPYTPIAQVPHGATSSGDSAISFGTTYCYQVAAVSGARVSNLAYASPSGGFTLAAAEAGTVSNSPAGINCGTACSYTYSAGTDGHPCVYALDWIHVQRLVQWRLQRDLPVWSGRKRVDQRHGDL